MYFNLECVLFGACCFNRGEYPLILPVRVPIPAPGAQLFRGVVRQVSRRVRPHQRNHGAAKILKSGREERFLLREQLLHPSALLRGLKARRAVLVDNGQAGATRKLSSQMLSHIHQRADDANGSGIVTRAWRTRTTLDVTPFCPEARSPPTATPPP